VDDTLRFVHDAGFNVLRIWAFNDGKLKDESAYGKLQAERGACSNIYMQPTFCTS
jgi:hypothetical protein